MKHIYIILILLLVIGVSSCSEEQEELNRNDNKARIENVSGSNEQDSDSIVVMQETDEMRALQKEAKASLPVKTRANFNYGENYDQYFSSNIYAIREMPLTIVARGVGKDASRKFFYCNGSSQEVKLTNVSRPSDIAQQFYLKILPATTGIPYLIYSQKANTPLTVGHYRKHSNISILMSSSDNSIQNSMAGWDLIASEIPGYFAIQNEMYLGQTDPKNYWTVFNYSLEVNDNDEIRYAKYSKKPQQEFLITPVVNFVLETVSFDLDNAKITDAKPIEVQFTSVNKNGKEVSFSDSVKTDVDDTYRFYQNRSNIKFNLTDKGNMQLPTVLAKKLVILSNDKTRMTFYNADRNQTYHNYYKVGVSGDAPAKSLIKVTVQLASYNVEASYVATAKYNDRVIKFSGVWKGTIVPDPNLVEPTILTRFFNCTTGEEFYNAAAAKSFKFIRQ